jgi:predicted transcriptional regulator
VATSDPIELAAEILTAFVANNSVPRAALAALFEGLHSALKRLVDGGGVAPAVIETPEPAVSIRKSVTPDYLICLDDGRKFRTLRRHLAGLGMTPEQYRQKWSLSADYPMVAPNYAAQRSALAKNIGFGLREKPIAAAPASAAAIEAVTDTIEVTAPESASVTGWWRPSRRPSTRSRWLQSSRRASPSAKPRQRPRARWSRPRRRSR